MLKLSMQLHLTLAFETYTEQRAQVVSFVTRFSRGLQSNVDRLLLAVFGHSKCLETLRYRMIIMRSNIRNGSCGSW